MTTNFPVDGADQPIRSDPPRPHSHLPDRMRRLVERRVTKSIMPFAEAVRDELQAVRDQLRARDATVAALQAEVAEMRRVLDLQQKFAAIDDRLERIEARAAPTPLRTVNTA